MQKRIPTVYQSLDVWLGSSRVVRYDKQRNKIMDSQVRNKT